MAKKQPSKPPGVLCYLVGAGPGAIDLLTLRAERVLRQADAVIYDRLTARDMLDYAPNGAERIFVQHYDWQPASKVQSDFQSQFQPFSDRYFHDGSKPAETRFSFDSEKSIELLVRVCHYFKDLYDRYGGSRPVFDDKTAANKIGRHPSAPYIIVRLKGGDPLVFARAKEEMGALAKAGVPFFVIPGIPSFTAAAASATIPLTLRKTGQSFSVLTGHFSKEAEAAKRKVIATSDTVIYLMGVKNLERIINENIKAGKSSKTAVAVIESASLPNERIRIKTLGTLLACHQERPIVHPAILIIGQAVTCGKTFRSYRQLLQNTYGHFSNTRSNEEQVFAKLSGITLGLLRTEAEFFDLKTAIEKLGGRPIFIPLIKHVLIRKDEQKLIKALLSRRFRVMLFTSKRTVIRVWDILRANRIDIRSLSYLKIVAIGPGTAAQLRAYGIFPDWVATEASQVGIRDLIVKNSLNDILLPQSQNAKPWLVDWLGGKIDKPRSYHFQVYPLYKTVPIARKALLNPMIANQLKNSDILLITSTSALTGLIAYTKQCRNVLYREYWSAIDSPASYRPLRPLKPLNAVEASSTHKNRNNSALTNKKGDLFTTQEQKNNHENNHENSDVFEDSIAEQWYNQRVFAADYRIELPLPILLAMSRELALQARSYFKEYFTEILLKERDRLGGELRSIAHNKGLFDVNQYFKHASKNNYPALLRAASKLRRQLYFTGF